MLNPKKRLVDGSIKTPSTDSYKTTLVILGPNSEKHTIFYQKTATEVANYLKSLNSNDLAEFIKTIDASLLNKKLCFKILDLNKIAIDDFELDVGVPLANLKQHLVGILTLLARMHLLIKTGPGRERTQRAGTGLAVGEDM